MGRVLDCALYVISDLDGWVSGRHLKDLFVHVIVPIDGFVSYLSWWRHQMETFSALLAICAGNSPVTGEFPSQRPVTRSFDVFFDLRLNKQLSKQSSGWWFETPSRSLWRHCNAYDVRYRWAGGLVVISFCRSYHISDITYTNSNQKLNPSISDNIYKCQPSAQYIIIWYYIYTDNIQIDIRYRWVGCLAAICIWYQTWMGWVFGCCLYVISDTEELSG